MMPPLHPAACACPRCHPSHPADRASAPWASRIAGITLALIITATMAHMAERAAYGFTRCVVLPQRAELRGDPPTHCAGGPKW